MYMAFSAYPAGYAAGVYLSPINDRLRRLPLTRASRGLPAYRLHAAQSHVVSQNLLVPRLDLLRRA